MGPSPSWNHPAAFPHFARSYIKLAPPSHSAPRRLAWSVPAKEQAENLVDGHDVELWQLNRRICEFKAKG